MDGLLVIISAPSGVGKTTIIQRLLKAESNCTFSVSHTTRPPRNGEVNGQDYHFIDETTFRAMIDRNEFVEWAEVHGAKYGDSSQNVRTARLYGTSRNEITRLTGPGKDVLFEVDYQGGRSLMRQFPSAVSIFVLPPSMATIKERLTGRGTDDQATIDLRLHNARIEIATAGEYQYVVVNDDLDRTVGDVAAILRSQRCRADRHPARIRALVAEKV